MYRWVGCSIDVVVVAAGDTLVDDVVKVVLFVAFIAVDIVVAVSLQPVSRNSPKLLWSSIQTPPAPLLMASLITHRLFGEGGGGGSDAPLLNGDEEGAPTRSSN